MSQTTIVLPDGWTRAQLISCVEREIKLRGQAYPRWIDQGRLTPEKALAEINAMRAVLAVLRQLPAEPPVQGGLFR